MSTLSINSLIDMPGTGSIKYLSKPTGFRLKGRPFVVLPKNKPPVTSQPNCSSNSQKSLALEPVVNRSSKITTSLKRKKSSSTSTRQLKRSLTMWSLLLCLASRKPKMLTCPKASSICSRLATILLKRWKRL